MTATENGVTLDQGLVDDTAVMARSLVDVRERTIQKARIAFWNRLKAIERGDDDTLYRPLLEKWYERFRADEDELDRDIALLGSRMPIVELMTSVKGVGYTLAVKVAAMIDIERSPTISALWRYSGYGVTDGKRDRPIKGQKLKYNARLKKYVFQVGASFLITGSPYRKVYDEARPFYEENREWTTAHCHQAAMRKMLKLWLSHLWLVWRDLEGLPISDPYIIEHDPAHTHIVPPEAYGWKRAVPPK